MKSITLKEFKERFYPNVTNIEFSRIIGFGNSFVCKVMNGSYDCSLKSKKIKELEDYISYNFNLQLILESPFAVAIDKKDRQIKSLEKELMDKNQEIKQYREVIEELMGSVRIMVGAKESLDKGRFILDLYKKA